MHKRVQRKDAEFGTSSRRLPASRQREVHDVLRGSQPLPRELKEEMEARLGQDFSQVRVHADGAARASTAKLGVHAARPIEGERTVGVRDVLSSPGQRLDPQARTEMEQRFDADFSGVRIHADAAAKASASRIGARAYTCGNHVVLDQGGEARQILAHELTHVIQQRQGAVAGTDNGAGVSVSDPSDRLEHQAEAHAARVMSQPVCPSDGALPDTRRAEPAGMSTHVVQRVLLNPNGEEINTKSDEFKELSLDIDHRFGSAAVLELDQLAEDNNEHYLTEVLKRMGREYVGPAGVPAQAQPVQVPAAASAPIDWSSTEAFLKSVARRWGAAQGHMGCGILGNDRRRLYLSTSGTSEPGWFQDLVAELNSDRPHGWPEMTLITCPKFSQEATSNHAETRIMRVWGENECGSGMIRTTGPHCGDCYYLMGKFGTGRDATTGKRSGTGWVHPFWKEHPEFRRAFGPQYDGSFKEYDLDLIKRNQGSGSQAYGKT